MKLLGLEIDNWLNFNLHRSKLCCKTAMLLSVICRLAKDMNNNKKTAVVNNFVYSSFNYCSFAWNFCSWLVFVENREKRYRRLVLDDHEKIIKT